MSMEAKREYERAYRIKNRSSLCEKKRERYQKQLAADPEKVRAQARASYHQRKDQVAEQRRSYRRLNGEKLASYQRISGTEY